MTKNKKLFSLVTLVVTTLVVLFSITSLVEDVPNDKIIVNQFPVTGEIEVWSNPGMEGQWFGSTTVYDKAFQFWFGSEKQGEARKIVFNDAGNGAILGSARILLPKDDKSMKKIQAEFGTQANLEAELIAPTITKVVFATGPLLSSYESYAAKKNDLINFIEDQLSHGIYKTTIVENTVVDPITGESKTLRQAQLVPSDDPEDYGFQRQEIAPFATYNITLAQLSVDDISYDQKIIDQIQAQQSAAMDVQTSIAEAKKAEQDAKKEEALGKQKVARARAEQLVIKEKAVVSAEQRREVSKLEKDAAEFYKQKLILEGEGESAKKRLVMQADGALEQKLAAYIEVQKAYANAIQNYQGNWTPQVQTGGSAGSGQNTALDMMEILSIKAARDLALDVGIDNK